MGKVQSKELANGNFQLEITYGGVDAPFGGVDTSAPPPYIDPRCFTASDGLIIVNNKICAVAFKQPSISLPPLWNNTPGVYLIGAGTFYNSIHGQLNYVLGYIASSFAGPPSGVSYTFYITSWVPDDPSTYYNDTLTIDLYDSYTQATAASLTLPCVPSSSIAAGTGTGATGNISSVSAAGNITGYTLTGGTGFGIGDSVQLVPSGYVPSDYGWIIVDSVGAGGSISTSHLATNYGVGYSTGPITSGQVEVKSTTTLKINGTAYSANAYTTSVTAASIVSSLVYFINNAPDPNVKASQSLDGNSIILTALTAGTAGNSITVQDTSTAESPGAPPPFYFPAKSLTTLAGGTDQASAPAPTSFGIVSSTSVGGTVYFANLGPMILKYSGPGTLEISSMYEGVSILGKFAGSLIGLGIIPQLGFETQDQDMIFAWTAAGQLDTWAPLNGSGNVTGAGFEQLADIGEFLSGLIVSNGTAYILRKEGVSYATATGNAAEPFAINHIGLGLQGEGTQIPVLVTQYDNVGCYIGNSDVWQITNGITPIGAKIKSSIFAYLSRTLSPIPANQLSACAASVFIGGNEYPIAVFVLQNTAFIFNTLNGTWSTISIPSITSTSATTVLCIPITQRANSISAERYSQAEVGLITQTFLNGVPQTPTITVLTENISDANSISGSFSVTFPQEEISFGRDITIDALYIALQASLESDVTLNVYLNGNLYASYSLLATAFNNANANPTELQIFPASTTGVNTGHSPQLMLEIQNAAGVQNSLVRFTKISMFGSIEPDQRPV